MVCTSQKALTSALSMMATRRTISQPMVSAATHNHILVTRKCMRFYLQFMTTCPTLIISQSTSLLSQSTLTTLDTTLTSLSILSTPLRTLLCFTGTLTPLIRTPLTRLDTPWIMLIIKLYSTQSRSTRTTTSSTSHPTTSARRARTPTTHP